MNKPSIYFKTISLALAVGMVMSESLIATASINYGSSSQDRSTPSSSLFAQRRGRGGLFKIGGIRSSSRRTGGIARGNCGKEDISVIPLWIQNTPEELSQATGENVSEIKNQVSNKEEPSGVQLTVAKRPTFFVYIPQTTKQQGQFTLQDESGEAVHEETVALPSRPGIVRLSLPDKVELIKNQPYHWSFAIVCEPADFGQNFIVDGWVERIESKDEIAAVETEQKLNPDVYQELGVWTESISTLTYSLERDPNNQNLKGKWANLLQSVGLQSIADKEIIGPLKKVEN